MKTEPALIVALSCEMEVDGDGDSLIGFFEIEYRFLSRYISGWDDHLVGVFFVLICAIYDKKFCLGAINANFCCPKNNGK